MTQRVLQLKAIERVELTSMTSGLIKLDCMAASAECDTGDAYMGGYSNCDSTGKAQPACPSGGPEPANPADPAQGH